MMNTISFNIKIKSKNTSFSTLELTDLKSINKKYPYFQLSAMLTAKAMLKNNDTDYKKQLSKTATLVQSREVLFDFLYNDILYKSEKISEQKPSTTDKPKLPTENKKPDNKSTVIKSTTVISKPKPIINVKGKELKSKKELMQEVSNRLAEIKKTKAAPKEIIKDSSTPITSKKATPTNKAEITKKQTTNVAKPETKKTVVKKDKKVTAKKETKPLKTKEVKPKNKAVNKSQKVKLETKDVKEKKTTSTKGSDTKKSSTKKASSANKKTIKKTRKEAKQVNRGTSLDLIERFIKEEPSINKPEDKDYSSELDFAKNSLTDNYDIVSETMAVLYSKQGNKKKAKKIYEKLILIYPEKSTYFANRILNLE